MIVIASSQEVREVVDYLRSKFPNIPPRHTLRSLELRIAVDEAVTFKVEAFAETPEESKA